LSVPQSFSPVAAAAQTFCSLASERRTQACPTEVSQVESSAQNFGHALAFWQILPPFP
jgi:hypothetical protein